MSIAFEILVILLLIVLNGLFAMSEMAMVSVRRARLAVLDQQKVRGAATALYLSEDPQHFLPTVQVGITLVSVLAGSVGGSRLAARLATVLDGVPSLRPFAAELSLALVVVLITFLTLVLGELVPKQLALRRPERIAALVARPLVVTSRVTGPFVWLLSRSSDLVLKVFGPAGTGNHAVTEEELKHVLAEGAQAGVLVSEERDMIERVLRLADKPVRAIMTSRTELSWIDRTDSRREIVAALQATPHSRVVVCDGGVDNPIGIVQAKDMLDQLLDGGDLSIANTLRKPAVMPDTVTALGALARLRSDKLGLALVMDEYGSFEGVVTASDVLLAITGEPEPDAPTGAAASPEGVLVMDGLTSIDEVKNRLSLPDLPAAGSYHTLAGLLLALLRRVPRLGDQIAFAGWRFEVTDMDGRRVAQVRASRDVLAES